MAQEELARTIKQRLDRAESDRHNWMSHWREIAERVLPSYSDSFDARGYSSTPTQGEKRTEEMVDATAALALSRFAAVRESLLTPRNSKWHRLRSSNPAFDKNERVKLYFEQASDTLFKRRYAPMANFASQNFEVGMSLGAFGTGVLFVDALDSRYGGGLRYKAIHLAEVFFLENHQGIIDTALRKFSLTARQAEQWFGEENLPPQMQEALQDERKAESPFWFIHCVKPREEAEGYDPGRADVRGMFYASYYVALAGDTGSGSSASIVREGGYNKFPYAIDRYITAPGETYGRSPAMLALPSIKTLNEQKKTVLKQGHRTVDPVLLAYDDGALDGFNLTPGSVNFGGVDANGRPLVQTLPAGNLAVADRMMEMEREVINDVFLITLFQVLVESHTMTATEVMERAREKGALLSPTMGRSQTEYLGPLIERELDVLAQQGLLPEMPEELIEAGTEFDTIYDSPLSRAQRAEEATGLMRLMEWASAHVQITGDPSPLDWVDWDAALPELADISAVPFRWMRNMKGVEELRASRAQQQQMQTMIEAAPAAAGLVKAAG